MRDNISMGQLDTEKLALRMNTSDKFGISMIGESHDKIYEKGKLVREIKGHNLVVGSFLNLIMCFLKQQSGYSGIQYWAIGEGANSWDSSLPNPELSEKRLTMEIGRVPISQDEICFLNDDYDRVETPTNILQISHTFGEDECNGVWREFAIFGGNATEVTNSGIMINKRHHAVITKTEEMTIERIMRFTLNLV